MNKAQFKAQYITNFISSYMAGRYDSDCSNGHPNKPYNHQPISDANFLAEKAWEQLQNHVQELRSIPDNIFVFEDK
jgi:hypothetical protein